MKKDYRFLIGQRFAFGGAIYVVQDLTTAEDRIAVRANTTAEDPAGTESLAGEVLHQQADSETFSLSDVIQWLLVDEEIELFNPNFLAAR